MSAKHGLTRPIRLIGCLAAVALLVSAFFASTAGAMKGPPTNKTTYIAMGDSISYGYSQEKFDLNFPAEPPSAFEGGLVNLFAAKLAKREAKAGNLLETANLACPGETSKGLIGNGPISKALEANPEAKFTGGEAPCGWHNLAGFPRHVEYGGVSQLEEAVGIISANPSAVKAVTLQIGSNDELQKLGECGNPAYLVAHKFTGFLECVAVEAKNTLFPTILINTGDTIGVLRSAGYTGKIVVLGFYNPQTFQVPSSDTLQSELNKAAEATVAANLWGANVKYQNPFGKTNPAKKGPAAEKAAICKYTEECNNFDKTVNTEEARVKKGKSAHPVENPEGPGEPEKFEKEQKEFEAEVAAAAGDIHPTPAGHALFAKLLWIGYLR